MLKILLVDDHEIIIDGISAMLLSEDDIQVVGHAYNGKQAIQKTKELSPNIIIMDISMPEMSGIEATKIIKTEFPDIKILILTQQESKEYALEVMKSGADGYLLKNSKKEILLNAIDMVSKGENYISSKISMLMLTDVIEEPKINKEDELINLLTKREIEIIKYLAGDMSNQEVADKLNISLRTVETHRRNIMQKLNIKTAVSLVRFAIKNNIVKL